MREIKFRAWAVWDIDKTYKMGRDVSFDKTNHSVVRFHTEKQYERSFDFYLMQYTGLKDKNGKEIYEGDIIKNHQADVNIVHWFGNGWHYENYHAASLPLDDLWNPYSAINVIDGESVTGHELIGNIHQNPELCVK